MMVTLFIWAVAVAQLDATGTLPTLNDGAGVLNGQFRYWAEGGPLHWIVTGGREHYVHRGGGEDAPYLETGPGYNYVQITQRIDADRALGGATLEFSAEAYASEPESVKLVIRLEDGKKFHSDRHSGDGRWERLVVRARIPDDYERNWAYVTLHHYNTPKFAARFRNAQVRIVAD